MERIIGLNTFREYLGEQERSLNTVEKYLRDIRHFYRFMDGRKVCREHVIAYKEHLKENYQISSVNSMLAALNQWLRFAGMEGFCVRTCRQQRRIFAEESRELGREDYRRLVSEAKAEGKDRLALIIQTIASTGIRIGELKYITAQSLRQGQVQIDFKGKLRVILLPRSLTILLRDYCRKSGIRQGSIFVTKTGRPIARQNIWADMKALCKKAGVLPSRVFPHNLRHLFAKSFYERERDLTRLADYLGHSSVETTRRYVMISSREVCMRQLELGLLVS